MYQVKKTKIFSIVLPSMVEAENFSDHPRILPFYKEITEEMNM
jgi:hypothetical protein